VAASDLIYDVGIPCRHGHTTGRYKSSRKCVQCAKNAASKWNKNNPEKHAEHNKGYAERHPDRVSENYRNWRVKYPERVAAKNSNWQKANWDKFLAISSEWKRKNRPHVNAQNAKRRSDRVYRMPKWLTLEDINSIHKIYELARELSRAYGYVWHVDHIIPLKGKLVSGLHVPSNLQVIPGAINMSKGNRFHGI
jgi:hypothetical protein